MGCDGGFPEGYALFLLREAVEMFEMEDRFNEVGRDEWVWLQQARDVIAEVDHVPSQEISVPIGLCCETEPVFVGVSNMSFAEPFVGGFYGMSPEELTAMDPTSPWIASKAAPSPPPPPPPAPMPASTSSSCGVPNGGSTTIDSSQQYVIVQTDSFDYIPVVVSPEKKRESIDDIIYGKVTPTAPKLG